ncbi:FABP family protein [Brachybacterium sp. NBEC-018]|uniref:FABP family protein n=1 Tax=Brachybacterium sp. NBEC-018 TaxID=2996004 RepID=UPI0021756731|nr:FABP family protein [Brachybacterium sp. NBEC-018]UVY85261.1 FABP family protein [Brachybacterium sp. NBEC-018]
MPITLDPSLPPSLYPLAWLVGSWQGSGAVHHGEDAADQRVEQQLRCEPREDGTLAWTSVIHVIDAPAPLPPTSAFAKEEPAAPAPSGSGQRSLLLRESGVWTVGEPLPGQDLERARTAKPGSPEATLSYALTAELESGDGAGSWAGEVRGPRIQLALADGDGPAPAVGVSHPRLAATRMLGYVGGRLMWLWERRDESAGAGGELAPYLSLELDRA